jgi:hypothetical protein
MFKNLGTWIYLQNLKLKIRNYGDRNRWFAGLHKKPHWNRGVFISSNQAPGKTFTRLSGNFVCKEKSKVKSQKSKLAEELESKDY